MPLQLHSNVFKGLAEEEELFRAMHQWQVQMHTLDNPLSIKVFPTTLQKIPVMFMDAFELHSHSKCEEVLPKSCFAHLLFISYNKFSLGKEMLSWVQAEFAVLASQPGTCWSTSDFCSLRSIASRAHLCQCIWCYCLSFGYLLVRSHNETLSLRWYIGKHGGKLSLFSLW